MSYAIIRNENHKMNAVPLLERHNERLNKNYSNKDIDLSRSCENYHLKQIQSATYQQEFERIKNRYQLKGNLRLQGKKQSTVMCEFVITSDKDFFERLGTDRTKQFFKDAYSFVTAKVGGEQYIVSAVVHMDEATPHMHVVYIPVINGKDRNGVPCKRINCSEFWKGRDSYSKLQDEYFDFITNRGYDLERGVKGSTAEHLSVAEYKLKKSSQQLAEIKEQISEIDNIENVPIRNLPLNNIAVKRDDFERISLAAKKYFAVQKFETENVSLKDKCTSLQNKNEKLKNDNAVLSGNLKQLEDDFENFYSSVEDEVALKNENNCLSLENSRLGNQVHTLQNRNTEIENILAEKDNQLSAVNEELSKTKSLLKSLQDKFNKVMKFIKNHNLKEKLETFLKPITKNHLRTCPHRKNMV
ncbi:MAG: plasmid recombination protein [Ruminococcus sp.]|nr:plasmid recombination protein [Ruminococcus sp.]MCM1480697.1 plasmid recombination protein [Muribaculaceae bacterium]